MEEVKEAVKSAEFKIEPKLTVLWHDLPSWQQDNHYILSGYRPASNSYKKSIQSLGYIHNETVNIYSHLIGSAVAFVSALLLYHTIKPRYEAANNDDVLVFGCFFAGAMACLSMSAAFHTMSSHSQAVQARWNKLDYLGIVALIWGSHIPSIYYGFQDNPKLVKIYWTMITANGIGCAIVSTDSRFRTPRLRPFRAGMFLLMGHSGILPVLHSIWLHGLNVTNQRIGLFWMVLQGLMYTLGAGLYATRVPERFKPGHFDIWGHSHQIFHILVVLAAATHLVGLVKAFDHQHGFRGSSYSPWVDYYRIR
ncbi:HlyIII-domain-containing protein [Patellaria atrata CBS 101060]|uniref:HlyIII-domain-containing protein n=1 Tax=Patellaria atrata CBS 101060 TaxID=1346257 RepID=A0A9P4VX45_9PEZI|nr:HlyIII-domain-containing protein [Patellaria atrata CBS 101060]